VQSPPPPPSASRRTPPPERPFVVALPIDDGGPPIKDTTNTIQHVVPPGPSCGADEVWEALCGGMGTGTGTCGQTADTNASWGYQRLVITQLTKGKADPVLRQFFLDGPETQAYAASIPPSGAGLPGPFCCHTRCTPLVVAARAAAPKPRAGFHLTDACISPPASTKQPAKQNASCPAAVEIGGVLAPFAGAHKPARGAWWYRANGGKSCCYTVVEADPPPAHHDLCPTCKCAAAGTPIATPDGEVAIESLVPGDLVLSMDGGVLRPVPLTAVHREPVHDHVMIVATLASGRSVAMSPRHPTADGHHFVDLAAGSRLGDARVIAVERVPYAGEYTYDLLPASDSATYVAAGALVGSTLRP
jgi:hypothetical protein